jgi:hypothetical protein
LGPAAEVEELQGLEAFFLALPIEKNRKLWDRPEVGEVLRRFCLS